MLKDKTERYVQGRHLKNKYTACSVQAHPIHCMTTSTDLDVLKVT